MKKAVQYNLGFSQDELPQPGHTTLCVFLHQDGFSYALYDRLSERFTSLYAATSPGVATAWDEFQSLDLPGLSPDYSGNLSSKILITATHESALIPAALYDKNKRSLFLNLSHNTGESSEILSDYLPHADACNIFPLLPAYRINTEQTAGNLKIIHHASVWLESILTANRFSSGSAEVHLHIADTRFDIGVTREGKLMLYNSFRYKTASDLLYYIMSVFRQLEMSPADTRVFLGGSVLQDSEIWQMLYKYIKEVRFEKESPALAFSPVLGEAPPHLFHILYHSILCVL